MRVGRISGWAGGFVAVALLTLPGYAAAGGRGLPGVPPGRSGPQPPQQIFKTVCSTCHGPQGKGNGPAGAAFNPHPANFTDPAFWKTHTDSQMVHSITNGKGMMPPFGGTYDQETIKALVSYLHVLGGVKPDGSPHGTG